ncbi:Rieske (2Fe-2S) protein [Patulibacter sp. NPDC049589]|uniref:Rieske (2Fe-2S) protein n=1 Tax=Patulibacter sp. NPDC049589 TaxID=3154731 RepID=UPI003426726A
MSKHVVARVGEIPDGGRVIVTLQGRSVGIFNVGGSYYALLNRCPHRGAELCRGSVLGRIEADTPGEIDWQEKQHLIQCPWHGWEFDIVSGKSYTRSAVRSYPVAVAQGSDVVTDVDSGVAAPTSCAGSDATAGTGLSAPGLRPGPFEAQTFPIAIEDEYIVVNMPGRVRAAAD